MRSYIVALVFWFMVLYEKFKRQCTSWVFYFSQPSVVVSGKWGLSAPDLYSAPLPQARPLSSRIVCAFHTTPGPFIDVTRQTIEFVSEEQNEVARKDVFVSSMFSKYFAHKLFVTYSSGMSTCLVVFKDKFVIPPSVRNANSKRPLWKVVFQDGTVQVDVTKVFEQFAGPAYDFYVGACYETTFWDVTDYLCAKQDDVSFSTGHYVMTVAGKDDRQRHVWSTESIYRAGCE